jgi:hypothetical protein
MLVWCVRLFVDFVPCFSFAMLDSTVDVFKEEEYFEYFEDNQGKPPKASHLYLLHILIPILFMQVFPLCLFQSCIVL